MKKFWILSCALILMGCANMTERQKQTAWIVTGVVVAAVIISDGGGTTVNNNVRCLPHNDGCVRGEGK